MKVRLLLVLLAAVHTSFIPAVNIHNYTFKEGLSNSNIICMFQDSKQRMWFGTWDGLNMYDSFQFKKWKTEFQNPASLSSNIILHISEDSNGFLWISTERSINRFDERQNTFKEYPLANAKFAIGSRDEIIAYVSDHSGLYYYAPEKDRFDKIQHSQLDNINVRELFIFEESIWILTHDKSFLQIEYHLNQNGEFLIDQIQEIRPPNTVFTCANYNNEIWMIKNDGWIIRYDHINDKEIKFCNVLSDLNFESSEFQDDTHLLVDTKKQLIYMNSKQGGIYKMSYVDNQIISKETFLKAHKISIVKLGSQDVLWAGTDGQGIFKISPEIYKFYNYDNSDFFNTEQKIIRAFYKDSLGTLWIGTKGAGIFCLSSFNSRQKPSSHNVKHFGTGNGLINNTVFVLYEDKNKDIIIGTDGNGINIFNTADNTIHTIRSNDPIINDNEFKYVYSIYQDNEGIYWLGTNRSGLIRLGIKKTNNTYQVTSYKRYSRKNLLTNDNVIAIVPENDSILWVGTKGGGVHRINTKDESCRYLISNPDDPKALSNNDVLCIYKDQSGTFWVGTFIGLNRTIKTDEERYVFEHYTEKDGLLDNTIRTIIEDHNGDFWISTNFGINKFDKSENTILSYDYRSGVNEYEFSDNAVFRDNRNNQLFFGGNKGFTCFFPEDILPYNYLPSVLFAELKIQNQNVNFYDYMDDKGILNLKYNQNFFTLYFNGIDYIQGGTQEYLYKLEDFSYDWVNNGNSNMFNFTNVPPGDYVFKIKCKNPYAESDEKVYAMYIHISKPWWKHPVAYIIYFLVFSFIGITILKIYQTRIDEKNALLIEKMNRKREEDIYESKFRFFTNIAHELSNQLTLINGRCEKMLEMPHLDRITRKYANIIESNAVKMSVLIKQIMEFRKAETGNLRLFVENISIVDTTKIIVNDFIDIIEDNKIKLDINFNPEVIIFQTDKDSFSKVLYNLISNAIKYTPIYGNISVDVQVIDAELCVAITNTGKGIKQEDIPYVFDRFRILDTYEKDLMKSLPNRNGIGLSLCYSLVTALSGRIEVKSDYGKNTTFSIRLPSLPLSNNTEDTINIVSLNDDDYFKEIIKKNLETDSDEIELPQTTKNDKKKFSVLVVEDNKDVLSLIYDTLKDKYNITSATNGVEALELIKVHSPDLVISDILMPGMDGYELTHNIKSNKIISHIPVILLSSKVSVEDQIHGFSSGADAYISKPFSLKHLETLVDRLLENKSKLERYFNSPVNQIQYLDGKVMERKSKEFIENLNEIIETDLEKEDLNPDYLSMKLSISRIQLYRKLKILTGKSPSEYIRYIRLNHCCKLLLTTTMTVQEIMFKSGFNNKGSFHKEFSKAYNCSPNQYREKQKNEYDKENLND